MLVLRSAGLGDESASSPTTLIEMDDNEHNEVEALVDHCALTAWHQPSCRAVVAACRCSQPSHVAVRPPAPVPEQCHHWRVVGEEWPAAVLCRGAAFFHYFSSFGHRWRFIDKLNGKPRFSTDLS
jgi:hypothetical protein